MTNITKIQARQILDSRGNPTVEADVVLADGSLGRAAVPSGASTGKYEALELRDGDNHNYQGLSVHKAIKSIHGPIALALTGRDATDQKDIDDTLIALDGTTNKSRLGANATLAVSLATAAAAAKYKGLELFHYLERFSPKRGESYAMPYGLFNIINGGRHAQNSSDFQEYMIVPTSQQSFAERLRCASEIFHTLKALLGEKGLPTTVGDEGGFAPPVRTNLQALEYITKAIEQAGYQPGSDVFIALDIAASEFYRQGKYVLSCEKKKLTTEEMIEYCEHLAARFPIISLEDPLDQEDFVGWSRLTTKLYGKVQIVGDDLYATNAKRLQTGIDKRASTAILIKPNQIGTLSETIDAVTLAYHYNMKAIVSHRSGETADTFIADLAVALRAGQVKFGSLSRSERLAKYDRLLQIEEIINR